MLKRLGLLVLATCASAPTSPEPTMLLPPPIVAGPALVLVPAEGPMPAPAPGPGPPSRIQPARLKLKLGHFSSARRGIGVVIDLSEETEDIADIDPAKVRFDGESTVWRLEGQHGGSGRIDFIRPGGRIMLQVEKNGDMTVYVPDPDGKPSEPIHVVRDGDADPL